MSAYIIRRLLVAIPTLFAIALITFLMGYYAPGDPATILLGPKATPEARDAILKEFGLDKPAWQQFTDFIVYALQGKFGKSIRFRGMWVGDVIKHAWPVSASIAIVSVPITVLVAIPFGIFAALRRGSLVDKLCMLLVLLGISVPSFVMCFVFMYVLALQLHLTPVAGWGQPAHYIIPVAILGYRPMAFMTRLTRSSMLDVLRQDYIRTARAKGLSERVVIYKHSLRNALIPVVTVIGNLLGGLLTGAFFVERILNIPGLGRISVTAIQQRDYPVILATTLIIAIVFVLMNLTVDIVYTFIDPRIRYT